MRNYWKMIIIWFTNIKLDLIYTCKKYCHYQKFILLWVRILINGWQNWKISGILTTLPLEGSFMLAHGRLTVKGTSCWRNFQWKTHTKNLHVDSNWALVLLQWLLNTALLNMNEYDSWTRDGFIDTFTFCWSNNCSRYFFIFYFIETLSLNYFTS